jgi:hypothetical protein
VQQRRKGISPAPSRTGDDNCAFGDEPLHVLVHGLPSTVELLSCQANDIGRMRVDVLDNELSNGLATDADLAHVLSTMVTDIVNQY